MKINYKKFLILTAETLFLMGAMLFSVFPLSCRVTVSGLEIVGAGCTVPVIEKYEILDSSSLSISFSDEVNLLSASLTKSALPDENNSLPQIKYSPDKKTVSVIFNRETDIGAEYIFTGEVEASDGSSLLFSFPFTGYNSRPASLLLTEIMDGVKTSGTNKIYEFLEFYVLESGNLAGLKIKSINDGPDSDYIFPPMEVTKGDIITLHLRPSENTALESISCFDEISDYFTKDSCTAPGSSSEAWDLWIQNSVSRLGGTQDIIILENSNTSQILQCLVYSKNDKSSWSKEKFSQAAENCAAAGLWLPDGSFENAFLFPTSAAFIRTNIQEIINKYEEQSIEYPVPSNKDEWKRITQSQVTPGKL